MNTVVSKLLDRSFAHPLLNKSTCDRGNKLVRSSPMLQTILLSPYRQKKPSAPMVIRLERYVNHRLLVLARGLQRKLVSSLGNYVCYP
jgi:hypothetical protein